MIVSIIGPENHDMSRVAQLLRSHGLCCLNLTTILGELSQSSKHHLISHTSASIDLFSLIEGMTGNAAVYGNALLNTEMCKYLVDHGSPLCLVYRSDTSEQWWYTAPVTLDFWNQPDTIHYNLATRFEKMFKQVSKGHKRSSFLVDLSSDDKGIGELNRLLSYIDSRYTSTRMVTEREVSDLMSNDTDMSIEESIRKAMAELGIQPNSNTSDSNNQEEPKEHTRAEKNSSDMSLGVASDTNSTDSGSAKDRANTAVPFVEDNTHIDSTRPETGHDSTDSASNSMAIKISNHHMALLFPSDLQLDTQEIDGQRFYTLSVELPDWNDDALQELEVVATDTSTNTPQKHTETPIEQPAVAKHTSSHKTKHISEYTTDDLTELREQKHKLDARIKAARKAGDDDLVKSLRKQRRKVRNVINQLKDE